MNTVTVQLLFSYSFVIFSLFVLCPVSMLAVFVFSFLVCVITSPRVPCMSYFWPAHNSMLRKLN